MSIENYIENKLSRSYLNQKVLITGGASGIGLEAAKIFLSKGADLILALRNMEKGELVAQNLKKDFPQRDIKLLYLDLASFQSIDAFISNIKKENLDVNIFINNAGVFHLPKSYSKDRLEIVMATNYFGLRYLNDLFFEYAKSLNHPVEIILSSSLAANFSSIDYRDFFFEKNYSKLKVYGRSKRLVIHYYLSCLEKEKGSNLTYYLTHPGASYTPLILKAYPTFFILFAKPFMKLFFHSPKKAALPYLFALEKQVSGAYYYPRGLFHFSGYPKQGKVNKRLAKGHQESQEFCSQIIDSIKNKANFD